jgi:hypothetical protein
LDFWSGNEPSGNPEGVSQENDTGSGTSACKGCQMVYFQTKKPHLGKFLSALELLLLVFLCPFVMCYGHLVI